MKNLKMILPLTFWLTLGCSLVLGQNREKGEVLLSDKNSLDLKMDELIEKHFYRDSSEVLKIVFTLKVDSLGEVHSAHIRTGKNLKYEYFYAICMEIESKFTLPFIYEKYKVEFKGDKYIVANYPYFSERK